MIIFKKILAVVSFCIIAMSSTPFLYSQSAGTLTFSCSTTAPAGDWGTKHVLAIWIQNSASPSAFIKTKAKYGSQDDHLTSWIAISNKNKVDAVTGSTLSAYDARSVIWDGTDVSSAVVADGEYKIFVEMGWGKDKTNQHSVYSFSFTKGSQEVHLTPTGTANYSNVKIDWVPLSTLTDNMKEASSPNVFPNPTNGLLSLKINKNIPSAKIRVENALGAVVCQVPVEENFTGELQIDLSNFKNGLYFLKLYSPESQYVYKVILQK